MPYMVHSFDDEELWTGTTYWKWTFFNKEHAQAHIIIEHTFAWIKRCFPALKMISGRDIKRIYYSIEAILILHNIFLILQDHADEDDDFDPDEDLSHELQQHVVLGAPDDITHVPPLVLQGCQNQELESSDHLRRRGQQLCIELMDDIVNGM
jgi:DDE superfamily endonuclease